MRSSVCASRSTYRYLTGDCNMSTIITDCMTFFILFSVPRPPFSFLSCTHASMRACALIHTTQIGYKPIDAINAIKPIELNIMTFTAPLHFYLCKEEPHCLPEDNRLLFFFFQSSNKSLFIYIYLFIRFLKYL